MPFKSQKQRRFMHAKHPDIAKRWESEGKKKGTKKVPKMPRKKSVVHRSLRKAKRQGLITKSQKRKAVKTLSKGTSTARKKALSKGIRKTGGASAAAGKTVASGTRALRKSRKASNRQISAKSNTPVLRGKHSGKTYTNHDKKAKKKK